MAVVESFFNHPAIGIIYKVPRDFPVGLHFMTEKDKPVKLNYILELLNSKLYF